MTLACIHLLLPFFFFFHPSSIIYILANREILRSLAREDFSASQPAEGILTRILKIIHNKYHGMLVQFCK